MKATLKGWLHVPYDAVEDLGQLREQLTHTPRRYAGQPRKDPILLYRDIPESNTIAVPQAYGRHVFGAHLEIDDQTVEGEPISVQRLPSPNHSSVEDPAAQQKFMEEFEEAARLHKTFNVHAPTGSGKTVVALRTAAVMGRKTLILVHLQRLRDQWVKEIHNQLGVPLSRIGTVDGENCDFRDKDFVVAMLQSVAFQPYRYPEEFYTSFGTLIVDEVHRAGAPMFSQSIWQFPARNRWGLSATLERKDKADKIFLWHLGPIKVRSTQLALPMEVWPRWYDSGSYRLWGNEHGSRVKCLSLDANRNALIGKLVKRMYDQGRQTIIVAEGVQHLQHLMKTCERLGVPADDMGQFTSMVRYHEKVQVGGREQSVAKTKKQSARTLEDIKDNKQMIFATYGMIKEGIDIPRLDAGIDATPRSDGTQLIGRLRRPYEGKRTPILWVTIVDSNCDRSLRYYEMRSKEYTESGAVIKHRT